MSNLALEWDEYNFIGTVHNTDYPAGIQFTGEENKPNLGFEYDCLTYDDNFTGNENYYTDLANKMHPLSRANVEAIRTYAAYFSMPIGQDGLPSAGQVEAGIIEGARLELEKTEYLIASDMSGVPGISELLAFRSNLNDLVLNPAGIPVFTVPSEVSELYALQSLDPSYLISLGADFIAIAATVQSSIDRQITALMVQQSIDIANQTALSLASAIAIETLAREAYVKQSAMIKNRTDNLGVREAAVGIVEVSTREALIVALFVASSVNRSSLSVIDEEMIKYFEDYGITEGIVGTYGTMPIGKSVYTCLGLDNTVNDFSTVVNAHMTADTWYDAGNSEFKVKPVTP